MDCRTDINYEDARGKKNRAVSIYSLQKQEPLQGEQRLALQSTRTEISMLKEQIFISIQ
jgi:hypothetical protein